MRMFTYDGDTPQDARRAVRARANLVLTNPDMLHSGILPHHTKWVNLFQNLRYVVIDELHAYRGVFGSHLANVLRRLKRICRALRRRRRSSSWPRRPSPTRGELAERLTGEAVDELTESGAPTGEKIFVCYNPPVVNPELGIRAPYLGEAAKLASALPQAEDRHHRVRARAGSSTEVLLASIKKRRRGQDGRLRASCAATAAATCRCGGARSSRGCASGDVLGVVSTNALELGDRHRAPGRRGARGLSGHDRVACGSRPAARAGASGQSAAMMVATSAPMDQFLVAHPDYLFGAPPEHARINPDNPFILVNHLKCAAFELPFAARTRSSAATCRPHLAALEDEGVLHRAGGSFHWTSETYPGRPHSRCARSPPTTSW